MPLASEILDQLSALVGRRDLTQQEFNAWAAGAYDGGPDGDGMFPFTDGSGFVRMVPSPARMAYDVEQAGGFTLAGFLALPEATEEEVAAMPPQIVGRVIDATTGLPALKRFTPSYVDGGGGGTPPDPDRIAISGIRTAGNLSARMTAVTPPGMTFLANPAANRIVNIDATNTYQAFIGAGASLTESACFNLTANLNPTQRAAILNEMFDTNGHNLIRICLGDSDFCVRTPLVIAGAGSFETYDDTGATDGSGFDFSNALVYVVPRLLEARAINPDLKIIASPWTPPAAFKSIGATLTTGTMNEATGNLEDYADYVVKELQAFETNGVTIDYMTIQNEIGRLGEGDDGPNPYPACQWTVEGSTAFIGILGPKIAAATSPALATQIIAGDDSVSTGYVEDAFGDPSAEAVLAGSAVHAYNESLYNFPNHQGAGIALPWIMTEISSYSQDPSISARYYASGIIMPTFRSGGSGITLWNAFLDTDGQPGITSNVPPMINVANNGSGALVRRIDYYMISHIARYVQRDAVRIDSTTFAQSTSYTATGSDLETVAFKNPDGSIAVILWNGASVPQTVYLRDVVGGGVGTLVTIPARDFQTYLFRNSPASNVPDKPIINAIYNSPTLYVSLKKDAPCNNGAAIGGYDIYVGGSAGYAGTKVASNIVLPAALTLDLVGQPYVYAQAINSRGNSASGNEVAATSTVTDNLTFVQVAGTDGDFSAAPSITLDAPAVGANTVIVTYIGDTYLNGPAGAVELFRVNDVDTLFFQGWAVPGFIMAGGTGFTPSGGTPYGWQMTAHEIANVERIALSTHGAASQFANIAFWQSAQPIAEDHISIVALGWNAGGNGVATTQINGGSQGTNGIITDSAGPGGLAGLDYYHGGIILRKPSAMTGEDYFNVTADVDFDRSAFVEITVT